MEREIFLLDDFPDLLSAPLQELLTDYLGDKEEWLGLLKEEQNLQEG